MNNELALTLAKREAKERAELMWPENQKEKRKEEERRLTTELYFRYVSNPRPYG